MIFARSRALSAATAAYGAYALAKPDHLGQAMSAGAHEQPFYDRLARAYGVRDLAISALGVAGPAAAVRTAMGLRIAMDLADAALLTARADSARVRGKVLAVTLGWAALNALALTRDRAQAGR